MHMNKIQKFGLGALIVAFAASCSMSTSMDANMEREASAAVALKEESKIPSKPTENDVIHVKDDIYLGNKSDVEFEGEQVPQYLEKPDGITLISNRPVTLYEIGDMINKTTNLKVRYAPQLEGDVVKSGAENKPTDDMIGNDWTTPDKMLLSYKGPLSGLLDEVCTRFGIWWKYEKRELYFYKYETKTFVIYSLPSKPSLTATVGGKSSGKEGGSTINLSNAVDIELWSNIEKSIISMIDKDSKLTVDPGNGTISLTATPNDIAKVAKFVNEQNVRLSRQVAISVKVLQVAVNDTDSYALSANALFKDSSGTSVGIRSVAASSSIGSGMVQNLSMAIAPGNWNIDAAIQALSTQSTVNIVTSGTVTTLNNKPAPIQVVRSENYIAEVTKTNSGGDGNFYDISIEMEQIETGFTMNVLPRILEHGRLLMMFNLTLSDLLALEKVYLDDPTVNSSSSGQYVQNPIIESRGFTQEVALKSGESLILTGYEKNSGDVEKTGLGSVDNSLLGGSAVAEKKRNILVIILTPVVLASPLAPESRMNY